MNIKEYRKMKKTEMAMETIAKIKMAVSKLDDILRCQEILAKRLVEVADELEEIEGVKKK